MLFILMAAIDRLAGQARLHHHHHRPYHLLDDLCRRHRAVAPVVDGHVASRRPPWTSARGPGRCCCDITLPIISPGDRSRAGFSPSRISLDDVVITSFTTGPGATTLPILIWSKVKLGVTPDINALATIIVVVVGIGVAIAGYLMHRAEKQRERDIQMAIAANK